MSFNCSEDDIPFIAITVEPPVEDSAKLYYDSTQFIGGEDKGSFMLNTLGQLDDEVLGPMGFPGSPFLFEDDSTGTTPSMWAPRSPADPLSPSDFERPLEDILNSPGTPLDLSPAGSSPLSLNFDVNLDDDSAGNYLFYNQGASTFRNRSYSESGTVAPRDILSEMHSFSMSHIDCTGKDGLQFMAPLFEGDTEDNQNRDLVAFGQPAAGGSSDVIPPTDSSALFSGNLVYQSASAQDSIPVAPPSSQQPQPVYLDVQGPTKHRHSLSDPNLSHRSGSLSVSSSPRNPESKALSVQTQLNTAQLPAHHAASPQSSYLSPDAEPNWRKTRMRANSASNTSMRHTPYSRTSPRRSSDQLPLAEEADLQRHVSDPTGSSKYGANRTRSSRRKTIQQPVEEEVVSTFAQPSWDTRSLSSAPHSPASPSMSADANEGANLTKFVVASQKCKDASKKRRTANKPLFACTVEGCTSTFTAKHNVTNHMNSHFGQRPYQCRFCDGTFATSGTCNRHEKNCGGRKRS